MIFKFFFFFGLIIHRVRIREVGVSYLLRKKGGQIIDKRFQVKQGARPSRPTPVIYSYGAKSADRISRHWTVGPIFAKSKINGRKHP